MKDIPLYVEEYIRDQLHFWKRIGIDKDNEENITSEIMSDG
jgi:hypothetical protein